MSEGLYWEECKDLLWYFISIAPPGNWDQLVVDHVMMLACGHLIDGVVKLRCHGDAFDNEEAL